MELTIRPLRPGEEGDVCELLRLCFPDWASKKNSIEYLRWKYLDWGDESLFVVVEHGGKIIGAHGYVPNRVKIGGLVLNSYYGDDAATHPDYRGKGVYNRLVDYRENTFISNRGGCSFIYYLTTNPITIKNNLKRGSYYFPFPISHMIRIRDVGKHVEMMKPGNIGLAWVGLTGLQALNRVRNVFGNGDSDIYKVSEVDVNSLNSDPLWGEIKQEYDFIMVKDCEFLRWRYGNPKIGEFKVFKAVREGVLIGLMVTELVSGEYPQAKVDELLVKPGEYSAVKALFTSACRYYDKLGVNAISYRAVKGSPLEKLSRSSGFIYISYVSNMQLFYDPRLGAQEKHILGFASPSKLYFSYGDFF